MFVDGVNLLAKYNFTGNPACPGGFVELTIKQKDKLILIRKGHTETQNPLWWEVRNEKGECGFVPANYCLVSVCKISAGQFLVLDQFSSNNPY